jgi:hypothetical protein
MLVGNIATLRPLFRKMLDLGGSDSNTAPTQLMMTPNGMPSSSYHPYKSFDHQYEMGAVGSGKTDSNMNSTQIHGGADKTSRSSISSDSDSQKQIIENNKRTSREQGQQPYSAGGIVVSRQINVSHSQQ